MNKYQTSAASAFVASLCAFSPHAAAVSVSDYMVIAEFVGGGSHAFMMSDSEIGAIGFNPKTSPPGSLPTLPGGTARSVTSGITLDGDAALTNGGSILTFGNSDVHAVNTGDANPGSQGVDCSNSFNGCTDNGSQISSGNRFNQTSPAPPSFSTLAENNGVQGNINLFGITTELDFLRGIGGIGGLASTGTRDLSGNGGKIENETNLVWDFSGDAFTGLNVIDVVTDGAVFNIVNSNLTIKGDAGDTIIFRVENSETMNVSESNLLLDGGIGDNNVLWYVDADQGEESFNYNNVTFQGMSLWDIGTDGDNTLSFNNVQFCGQVVTDQINFQNVSGSSCAFGASVIPVPAAAWLFGSGLIGLAGIARRKKAAA